MRVCMHVCVRVCMHVCMHVCTCVYACIYIHVCVRVCMHVQVLQECKNDDHIEITSWPRNWSDPPAPQVEPIHRLLVIIDINETILYRKYLPQTRGYTDPKFRPHVEDFIARLLKYREEGVIHLATWCGAWTHKRENELLSLIESKGLIAKTTGRGKNKVLKTLDYHLRAMPGMCVCVCVRVCICHM